MLGRLSLTRFATGSAAIWLALCAGGCTRQLYDGPPLPPGEVAVIHVGETTVLNVDNRFGFALPIGARHFEVAPGPHRIILAYNRPATTIGVRDIPAQEGEGRCTVDFVAEAGRQYQLGASPVGTDWTMQRWDGKWEGWVRDTSRGEGDDIVGRCTSSVVERTPARVIAPVVTGRVAASPTATPRLAATPAPAPLPRVAPVAPPPVAPPPGVAPVVPAAAPTALPAAAPTAAPASIRLGTWNLPPLAGGGRNYAATAAIIEATFDVLTLTEVSGDDYRRISTDLGVAWLGMTTGEAGEQYAILYRRDALRTCPGWQDLRRSTVDGLRRAPVYLCFEVGGYAGTPAFEFLLVAYRAASAEDASAVADEVRHLDAALEEIAAQRPGERDIVVAGQFHLEADELALVTNASVRSKGAGASLNLLGEPSSVLRDHILVRDARATREIKTPGTAVDVRAFAASPQEFRRTVSDHLPVVVQVNVPARDDD